MAGEKVWASPPLNTIVNQFKFSERKHSRSFPIQPLFLLHSFNQFTNTPIQLGHLNVPSPKLFIYVNKPINPSCTQFVSLLVLIMRMENAACWWIMIKNRDNFVHKYYFDYSIIKNNYATKILQGDINGDKSIFKRFGSNLNHHQ